MKNNRKSRRLRRTLRALDSKVFNLDVEVWNEKTKSRSYRWEKMMNVHDGFEKFNADQLDSFMRLLDEVVEDEYRKGFRTGFCSAMEDTNKEVA